MRFVHKLIILCLSVLLLGAVAFAAADGDFEYEITDTGAKVTAYHGSDENVVIPETLGGEPVAIIGEKLFYASETVKSVRLPETVKVIESSAFYNATNLTEINIPAGMEVIGWGAFWACPGIKGDLVLNNLKELGGAAFCRCANLESVTLGEGLTVVPYQVFGRCTAMKKVNLPTTITSIEGNAFMDCLQLEEINLPKRLTNLGGAAFYCCPKLKDVDIPEGITKIEWGTFAICTSLENVYIPDGVTEIGPEAFHRCSNMKTVRLPDSITVIDYNGFRDCPALTSLNFPANLEVIGKEAFWGNTRMTTNRLPESVREIGELAFASCGKANLTVISSRLEKIGSRAFKDCKQIRSVYLQDPLTELGFNAFEGCSGITDVRLPGSLKSIPGYAFSSKKISSVELAEGIETIGEAAFYRNPVRFYNLPSTLKHIGELAFYGSKVKTVIVPDGVESLGSYCFGGDPDAGKSERITVYIPASVTTFDKDGFYGNTIYCYKGSAAHEMAKEAAYKPKIILITDNTFGVSAPADMTIDIDDRPVIEAAVFPAGSPCTYSSSTETVATVNADGMIIPAGVGTTTITIKCGEASDSFKVTVQKYVKDFQLNHEEVTVEFESKSGALGKVCTLKAVEFVPADATDKSVTWEIEEIGNEISRAEVDSDGTVFAIDPGDVKVYATIGSVTRTCIVHIIPPVSSFAFPRTEALLAPGEQTVLEAVAQCKGDRTYINRNMVFSSSDENVAVVDSQGCVTGLAEGEAVITAVIGDHTAQCTVYVGRPVDSVTADIEDVTVPVGEVFRIPVIITPAELAEGKLLAYESSDPAVAVGGLNRVEVVGAGTATIRVYDRFNPEASVSFTLTGEEMSACILPEGVKTIREEAFIGSAVEYVRISSESIAIAQDAFAGTDVRLIRFDGMKAEIDPTAFDEDASFTILCKPGSGAEAFALENGITCILK